MTSAYSLTEIYGGHWLVVAGWLLPGESMLFGVSYPHWRCFAGSRRRCKVWLRRLRVEMGRSGV